jgi:sulfonate transport system ATP-binding protein
VWLCRQAEFKHASGVAGMNSVDQVLIQTPIHLPCQRVAAPAVELRAIRHGFGQGPAFLPVVEDISLSIPHGQFVSIVGPSGCGKSTLLRLIAGLAQPAGGEIFVYGSKVTSIRTDVGYMFQTDALLPWRTVLDNVALPLKFQGIPRRERTKLAKEWIRIVGLFGFEGAFPHQLSGGMRKRVSLACTLVAGHRIILMDEPFSALDVQTRSLMENELMTIWQRERKTVLFITHDLEEAIALSDNVVVLSARPTRVKGVYPIPLPRPRNVLDIRSDVQFHNLYTQLWSDLRDEVMAGYDEERRAAGANSVTPP